MRPRTLPVVLLDDSYVVKTRHYSRPTYVGDPINTVKLFNEKGVDELVLLDIGAGSRGIDFPLLADIATEAFMPLAYGGGLRTVEDAQRILTMGFEKVSFNTLLIDDPSVLTRVAESYGAQAVVASIDVGRPRHGRWRRGTQRVQVLRTGRRPTGLDPLDAARRAEQAGAGEILLTNADREGDREGLDLELIATVSAAVGIPVVAQGGAGAVGHLAPAIVAGASAVAAGTMFTHYGPHRAVLITYPSDDVLTEAYTGQEPHS
jgi:cyclase